MSEFKHANDFIHIDDGLGEIVLPLSFFMIQEPLYNLPAPYIIRHYVPPTFHSLGDGKSRFGGSLPYTEGDTYISKKDLYETAYYNYLNPIPTLEEAKIIRISEVDDYSYNIKLGKVIYNTNTYFSRNNFLDKIKNEFERFTRIGSLPVGFYVSDENYAQISFTVLSNLSDLIDKILELWYLCDVNDDYHRTQINALSTVSAIQSYDFTTGWPAVPFN